MFFTGIQLINSHSRVFTIIQIMKVIFANGNWFNVFIRTCFLHPYCIKPESCSIWLLRVDVTVPFCRQWWTCCIGEICRGRGWCLEPVCSCCSLSACAVLSACSPTWPLPCCLSPSPSGYTKAFYRLFRSQRMGTPSSENAHMLNAYCDGVRLTCFHAMFCSLCVA